MKRNDVIKRNIMVVASAYGYQRVRELGGQLALLPIIAAAGADGVEIRRELLDENIDAQLAELATAIQHHNLIAFYSVPEALFLEEGSLNPNLDQHLKEAKQLNAQRIKYALGHYSSRFDDTILRQKLANHPVQLMVENDQTDVATADTFKSFFQNGGRELVNGMTFDTGNWSWVGEQPQNAAQALHSFVSYIHVKAAIPHGDSWRAIPLDDADNQWRELLALLPSDVPRAIEFPLEGDDLVAVTRHYINQLREE